MSTWMYLRCEDHNPPLLADEESGQHWYDVPRIRQELVDRDALVRFWETNYTFDWSFTNNTIRFMAKHPKCNLALVTEYGEVVEPDLEMAAMYR